MGNPDLTYANYLDHERSGHIYQALTYWLTEEETMLPLDEACDLAVSRRDAYRKSQGLK